MTLLLMNYHIILCKELFIQIFSTSWYHPKSQPFLGHMFTFTNLDNRIWFGNIQMIEEDAALVETGPHFALNLKDFPGKFWRTNLICKSSLPVTKHASECHKILYSCKIPRETVSERCTETEKERTEDYS